MVIGRGWGDRRMENYCLISTVSLREDGIVLGMDGGDGHTTM